MEDRSYRRNRALATPLAHVRGFPANEIECALISMMARSIVKRSTDRSDTLVQDPTSPAERLSPFKIVERSSAYALLTCREFCANRHGLMSGTTTPRLAKFPYIIREPKAV